MKKLIERSKQAGIIGLVLVGAPIWVPCYLMTLAVDLYHQHKWCPIYPLGATFREEGNADLLTVVQRTVEFGHFRYLFGNGRRAYEHEIDSFIEEGDWTKVS